MNDVTQIVVTIIELVSHPASLNAAGKASAPVPTIKLKMKMKATCKQIVKNRISQFRT